MKILVTGHRGFVGSHLCEAIVKAKHQVHGYDIEGGDDIRDRRKLEQLFETENYDMVIHLAALAGVRRGELYPEEYISTNVIGTKNVVELAEKYHVRGLISFSSSSVYGAESTRHWQLNEEARTEPMSIYGMTKLTAEHIVNRSNIPTVIIRPFTLYGPNGRKDQVVMRWVDAIKSNGNVPVYAEDMDDARQMVRGYTHVFDLVAGVMNIIETPSDVYRGGENHPFPMHRTYNLGGDTPISLGQLLKVFGKVKQFKYQFVGRQPGDISYSQADTAKAFKDLGWKPKQKFEKALPKIIKEGLRS